MEQNLVAQESKNNIVSTLKALTKAIENEQVSAYSIEQNSNGTTKIIIDSADKSERIIKSSTDNNGHQRTIEEHIKKEKPTDRRKTVKKLRDEGMTHAEIATRTMTSPKTVYNDLKKINTKK
jgi:DNA-binding NarL/FixJ family response regulator